MLDERARAAPGEDLARRQALERVPFLRTLPLAVLDELAARVRPVAVEAGEVVQRAGEPAERLAVVGAGTILRAGSPIDVLGEEALRGEGVYAAEARAEEDSLLLTLETAALDELRRVRPELDEVLAAAETARPPGLRLDVLGVTCRLRGGRAVLRDVAFAVEPGQLVAIAGASGAGKSMLLETIAGARSPDEGRVLYGGAELHRSALGYVPQDDIVHGDLSVEATLRYAARLRLAGASRAERDRAVARTLGSLGLGDRATQRVRSLSGGERKRASIGVELLTEPRAFLLDEPTSGLDPVTAVALMRLLRRLADAGRTVVLTTHATGDLAFCDSIVFLAGTGEVAFAGPPAQALEDFGVERYEDIYERVADGGPPPRLGLAPPAAAPLEPPPAPPAVGALRQCAVLARRNLELMVRSRLTLGILLGSPLMVVLMFVVLFRGGAFDPARGTPTAAVMILFWIAFGTFFFGVTYGLLQIATELPILRRERLVGLSVGAYVLAKLAVLLPLLLLVDLLMLGVLRLFDRLPPASLGTYAVLAVTTLIGSAAALALGLVTSAAVSDPAQATLALPMLCFPQVLFSGAILPVPIMAVVGRVLSYGMSDRWTFEALGHSLHVNRLLAGGPLRAEYGATFSRAVWIDWTIAGAMAVAFTTAAYLVCLRRCRTAQR